MKLSIDFDSSKQEELLMAEVLGATLEMACNTMRKAKKESEGAEDAESERNFSADSETPAQVVEEAPVSEPVQEEKPKRKRRTKAEIEAERNNAEEVKAEAEDSGSKDVEMANAQPSTSEPESPSEQPMSTLPYDKWLELLLQKRIYLGLCDKDGNSNGAPHAEARTLFVHYIYELSRPYGADKPKDLSDEARAKFYEEKFKHLQYDPIQGFYIGEPVPNNLPF